MSLLKKKDLKDYKRASGNIVFKKFRSVDPKVVVDGELVRLNSLSQEFVKLLNKHRKINEKGLIV